MTSSKYFHCRVSLIRLHKSFVALWVRLCRTTKAADASLYKCWISFVSFISDWSSVKCDAASLEKDVVDVYDVWLVSVAPLSNESSFDPCNEEHILG